MIFKAIFAQVRAPRAKMAEKCKKALITIIVIDMVIFKVFVKVMTKIVGLDPQDPQFWNSCGSCILNTLLTPRNHEYMDEDKIRHNIDL